MILKRKQMKSPKAGSLCVIKESVIEAMQSTSQYKEESVGFINSIDNGIITRRSLKGNKSNNKILLGDATLLFILNNSIFDGIVEVVPMAINYDSQNGFGARSIIDKQRTFLMRLDSLSFADQGMIDSRTSHYSYTAKTFLGNNLRAEHSYNKPRFSWEGN